MSLFGLFKGRGASGFGHNSTAEQVTAGLDLSGKTYLVTGCNSGIGAETARVLLLRGARVIGAARTAEKAEAAFQALPGSGAAVALACDLSEPASVRAAVAQVKELGHPLDGIIANAGIMALPHLEQKHGYELQFLTNHVGHHLLITCLTENLADAGRVVVVSSAAHTRAPAEGIQFDNLSGERGYSPWTAYGQSKLANLLFARHLAGRLPKPAQTSNAVHPGVINTQLTRNLNPVMRATFTIIAPLFCKSIPQGAATQCYVAVHAGAAAQSGEYFSDCNPARSSRAAQDADLAAKLWEATEEILRTLA